MINSSNNSPVALFALQSDLQELERKVDNLTGLVVGMVEGDIKKQQQLREEAGDPRLPSPQPAKKAARSVGGAEKLAMSPAARKRD